MIVVYAKRARGPAVTGRDWAYLLGLSALWGSSYLFIKIAVDGHLAPAELVFVRLVLATAVLYLVARLQGLRLPRDRRVWRSFAIMGLVGTALPFLLISWGETTLDSSLAAVLNATVPIATVLLSHYWTRQERLTPSRIVGLLAGFLGVVVVVGNVSFHTVGGMGALGVAALLLSSLCYGVSAIFARGAFGGVAPVVASMGQMLCGALYTAIPGTISALAERQAPRVGAVAAMVALALLGTVGAYLLYYRLIARVGATRTTTSTYLLPAFAVVYGALFLHESVTPRLLVGFALILLGIAFVTRRVTSV